MSLEKRGEQVISLIAGGAILALVAFVILGYLPRSRFLDSRCSAFRQGRERAKSFDEPIVSRERERRSVSARALGLAWSYVAGVGGGVNGPLSRDSLFSGDGNLLLNRDRTACESVLWGKDAVARLLH